MKCKSTQYFFFKNSSNHFFFLIYIYNFHRSTSPGAPCMPISFYIFHSIPSYSIILAWKRQQTNKKLAMDWPNKIDRIYMKLWRWITLKPCCEVVCNYVQRFGFLFFYQVDRNVILKINYLYFRTNSGCLQKKIRKHVIQSYPVQFYNQLESKIHGL